MGYVLKLFDAVRIDHFRGLVAYWEIPAHEKNAIHGWWVPAPAEDLFNTLADHFGHLPVMAEDLGFITPDVREIKERFRFPCLGQTPRVQCVRSLVSSGLPECGRAC